MKRTIIASLLMLYTLLNTAQTLNCENFSWLALAAENSIETENALIQLALFPESLNENSDFTDLMQKVGEVKNQYNSRLSLRELKAAEKELDNSIAELKKMMGEVNGEVKDVLQKRIAEMNTEGRAQLAEMKKDAEASIEPYSYDPKVLIGEIKKFALNNKFYTGQKYLDNGLYAVREAPRYDNAADNSVDLIGTGSEESKYSWGVVDETGKTVIPFKYAFYANYLDKDIIFAEKYEAGKTYCGAFDFQGKLKIAFENKSWVSFGKNYEMAVFRGHNDLIGVVSYSGKILQPAKYEDYFEADEGWNLEIGNDMYFLDTKGNLKNCKTFFCVQR